MPGGRIWISQDPRMLQGASTTLPERPCTETCPTMQGCARPTMQQGYVHNFDNILYFFDALELR